MLCQLLLCLLVNPAVIHAPLPGMPPILNPNDIYAADHANQLSPVVKSFPSYIYVPDTGSNRVDIIDPKSFKIVRRFKVGRQPQHVTPSYDLKTLWVLNDLGDSLTRIDPATGEKEDTVKVKDPYNMYYTPDGKLAIIVAERIHQLDFRDPKTMVLQDSLRVPCRGVDHMDFTADGRFLIASCEFSAELVKVDVVKREVVGTLALKAPRAGHRPSHHRDHSVEFNPDGMPQDVKTSPDGSVFYIADMVANGVYLVDPDKLQVIGFVPTGEGAHGLYPSRDSKLLYVSNRDEGSISVIDFATHKVMEKWQVPGGSPDMGGVSADGTVLWLSGRYNKEVYAIDTLTGKLLARIRVGKGPRNSSSESNGTDPRAS